MKNLLTPFRVGLLVLASAAFLFMFLTFVRKGGLSRSEANTYWAYFHDASGLGVKSRVEIAGIPVGEVEKIVLVGNLAKVYIEVRKDVQVRQDAALTKRSESLLGDYQIDLFPGDPSSPPLPNGGQIRKVIDTQGMEAIFESLSSITGDIQQVTHSLRDALGGPKGAHSLEQIVANLTKLSGTLQKTATMSSAQLEGILSDVHSASRDVAGITRDQQAQVRAIIENIRVITDDTRQVLATVKNMVGAQGQGDLKKSVASIQDTLDRLNHTMANVETITDRIKQGKGPVGELVSNERLGQKLAETVNDASDFVNRITRMKAQVSVKSEYLFNQGAAKDTLSLKLIPKPDKYYLLQAVDDPRGSVSVRTVQTNPPSAGDPVTQEQRITSDSLKFSAEFAKRYYFATLRFGIIESTGGVGADLHFFHDHLALKLDAFDFSSRELTYPRVRATVKLSLFQHVFLTAGADDILNRPITEYATHRLVTGRDFFLGGGIFFTDKDLESILTVVPKP